MLGLVRRSCNVGRAHLHVALSRNVVSYIQGQSPSPKVREYFYYIDHQGQVLYFTSIFSFCLILSSVPFSRLHRQSCVTCKIMVQGPHTGPVCLSLQLV